MPHRDKQKHKEYMKMYRRLNSKNPELRRIAEEWFNKRKIEREKLQSRLDEVGVNRIEKSSTGKGRAGIRSKIRYAYGISQKELDVLLIKQRGKCAICKKYPKKGQVLCVDHDHNTKKVRGLLCNKCNTLLGFIESSDETIDNLMYQVNKYLSSK